jgi:hypothetical protein
VPEEPSIAGVAPATARKGGRGKGARESGRREREISQRLRVSSESARARRSTKIPAPDCAECSAAIFVYSARNYTASAGGGYSARAWKKISYFSAAAGDALSGVIIDAWMSSRSTRFLHMLRKAGQVEQLQREVTNCLRVRSEQKITSAFDLCLSCGN